MKRHLVYLASPYSHADPSVREERYRAAKKKAAELMQAGHVVFCPIAHSHPIAEDLPEEFVVNHEFWMTQDLPILRAAERVCVLMLPGWMASLGVRRELEEARKHGIRVEYINP